MAFNLYITRGLSIETKQKTFAFCSNRRNTTMNKTLLAQMFTDEVIFSVS